MQLLQFYEMHDAPFAVQDSQSAASTAMRPFAEKVERTCTGAEETICTA